MNFLAHAYLSFNDESVLIGNMSSDFIKGKKQYQYSTAIQKGIKLHRAIDTFTDEHAVTLELKKYFHSGYRLYAGAFIDVVYDHFLANDPLHFSDDKLELFATNVYSTLEQNAFLLPEKLNTMLPYMSNQNWLYNYRYHWGIQKSFEGLVKRSAYLTESDTAFTVFQNNYNLLQQGYYRFFNELYLFTKNKLDMLP